VLAATKARNCGISRVAFLCAQNGTSCIETQHCSIPIQRPREAITKDISKSMEQRALRSDRRDSARFFWQWHNVRLRGHSVVAKLKKLSDNELARGASDERERAVALPLAALSAETFSARQRPRFFLPASPKEEHASVARLIHYSWLAQACHLLLHRSSASRVVTSWLRPV